MSSIQVVEIFKNGSDELVAMECINTRRDTIDQLRETVGRGLGFGEQWAQFVHHFFTAEGIELVGWCFLGDDDDDGRNKLYYASSSEEEEFIPLDPPSPEVDSDSDANSEVDSSDVNSDVNSDTNTNVTENNENNTRRRIRGRRFGQRMAPYEVPNRNPWNTRGRSAVPIKLNVGGTIFGTTHGTLAHRAPHSKLARMFDPFNSNVGQGVNIPPRNSTTGEYFIDRDPKYFSPLLNYLRTGSLVMDKDINPAGVFNEAVFFEIEDCIPPGWQTGDITVSEALAYFVVVKVCQD